MPLLEQAALWFDRASAGELNEPGRRAFESWRGANPAHATAYAEIEAAHRSARALGETNEMLALRHETLSRIVVRRSARPWRLAVAGGLAAMLVAAFSFLLLDNRAPEPEPAVQTVQRNPALYQTAIGERLAATLPDGSRIVLNTDSRLRVDYDDGERRLVLERGQAFFEVAHGQSRPFVVLAAGQRITATGTMFDVRIDQGNQVRVALVEGRVLVRENRAGAQTTAMQPSELLVVASAAATVVHEPEMDRIVSWRTGQLIFENESLAEAVSEVNRYVSQQIVLQDEQARHLRVSGAFQSGETGAFIEALELSFPVRVVERRPDAIVLATRR